MILYTFLYNQYFSTIFSCYLKKYVKTTENGIFSAEKNLNKKKKTVMTRHECLKHKRKLYLRKIII